MVRFSLSHLMQPIGIYYVTISSDPFRTNISQFPALDLCTPFQPALDKSHESHYKIYIRKISISIRPYPHENTMKTIYVSPLLDKYNIVAKYDANGGFRNCFVRRKILEIFLQDLPSIRTFGNIAKCNFKCRNEVLRIKLLPYLF